ncbi:MAG: DUF1800 domain-containing protein [Planctomycetota bacterium]|nr:DUF1800 domain-containing protein [Planctomycetota bacterium]
MQRLIALLSILAFTIQAQVVTGQAAAQNTGALAGKEFFEPWKPTEEDSWDIKKAAHLLRRAGFGGSMTEIKIAYQNGLEWALRDLIHCERVENPMEKVLQDVEYEIGDMNVLSTLQGLWLYRMTRSMRPLEEKMTLFWHGHFATSNYKVDLPYLMFKQNKLFRENATGKFPELLQAVSKDAAMILWLDNQTNIKGNPNENFAREIFELFTLSIGNYTEKDIQESARAFTGWQVRGLNFFFNQGQHDFGEKTVFGKTGNWNGEDICDMVGLHPATAKFLSKKLLKFFVMEEPKQEYIDALAEVYLAHKGDMKEVLNVLFRSKLFYSREAYRSLVKSPIELTVGTIRLLNTRSLKNLTLPSLDKMGQQLYNPPNVKGWDGGRTWINTITLLERNNFLQKMLMEAPCRNPKKDHPIFQHIKDKEMEPKDAVDYLCKALIQDDLSDNAKKELLDYFDNEVAETESGVATEGYSRKLRRIAYIIMTSPAYQAN